MTFGRFEGPFPRIALRVSGETGSEIVDFIIDTGFDGDITLPISVLTQIGASESHIERRKLASGPAFDCRIFAATVELNNEDRQMEAVLLDGAPLFGTQPMLGGSLHVELIEGAEVVVELAD